MESYVRKINYYETDQMGFVHHSNYIRYFEEARAWFMEQVGYPYAALEAENIVSPVLSVSVRYRHPVRYGETVLIRTRLTSMGRVKCAFVYEVVEEQSGQLRAEGSSEHCFLDREGKVVPIHKKNPAFYEAFLAAAEKPAEQ